MLIKYEKFLNEFQEKLDKYFKEHSEYICCKEGCSSCCAIGEYPFSWLEMGYLMQGFLALDEQTKNIIYKKYSHSKKSQTRTIQGITALDAY